MLLGRLAKPIFTLARAMPMVRTTNAINAIGPFCRAKTCSIAARTADLRALARRVRAAIGRPGGFLRGMPKTKPRSASHASFFAER